MNIQNTISIEASKPTSQDVVDVREALDQMSQGLVDVPVKEKTAEGDRMGDIITLAIVLEPIIKVGLEFLLRELMDWLKKKTSKDSKKAGLYSINIYTTPDGKPQMVTSEIGKAERKINSLLEPYIASRNDLKGRLFSLLGGGEPEEVLTAIVGVREEAMPGEDSTKVKREALALLDKIQQYKSAHPGEKKEDWDTGFKGMINRGVFDCINQLPQHLPVPSEG